MIKGIAKCSLCGKTSSRDELIAYNFPNGTRLVCKRCYNTLPPDPTKLIKRPDGKKRKPEDDLYPPF
ncbi:MAG: hypothetical protein FK733_06045 [Asgard group archaeon]|nr:hypothetical protein [Asgard group archaeon]